MKRVRGSAIIACSVCAWLACAAPSASAKPMDLSPRRAALSVAKIIRRDAHERYRQSRAAVTVVRSRGHRRVLRVHYSLKTRGGMRRGGYVLRLDARHGRLQGVAVFELIREAGRTEDRRRWQGGRRMEVAIRRAPHGGWEATYGVSEVSSGQPQAPGRPSIGLGFSRECGIRRSVTRLLYREALAMLRGATGHRASQAVAPSDSYC